MSTRCIRDVLASCCAVLLLALLSACGGGGDGGGGSTSGSTAGGPVSLPSSPQGANVVPLVVDQGTDGSSINTPFVTVTVCLPASSTCQTIDHVMVDTGSYGLRIAAGALPIAPDLPAVMADTGPLAECAGFVSGFAWGSVRKADVQIGGETAQGVPIQVVGDTAPAYTSVPAECSNTGPNMGVGSGTKGILGVGFLQQDCGAACVNDASPDIYFSCPASGCGPTTAALASQVTNPVALFQTDNNGVAITLPEVPVGGATQASGVLVFGVGTQSNNQVASPLQVFTSTSTGAIATAYKGQTLSAFIDSGSNGIFFDDAAIPTCAGGFYCPPSPLSLSATVTGGNGTSRAIPFTVESVSQLAASTSAAHLGGSLGGLSGHFDWGLPFFFRRTVFLAFDGAGTPFGTGPFYAF